MLGVEQNRLCVGRGVENNRFMINVIERKKKDKKKKKTTSYLVCGK